MDQNQLIRISTMLEQTLDAKTVVERARSAGFVKRLRSITPHRLVLSLIYTLAAQKVETLADLKRGFSVLCQIDVTYKSFYRQLAKPQFVAFMRSIVELLMERLVLEALVPLAHHPLARLRDIKVHDATEWKLPDWFRDLFPGRFPVKAPAVAALHTTLSLRYDQPVHLELSPQRAAARDHRPDPTTLAGELLLGDRAYADCLYIETVGSSGGSCLIRATRKMNPKILAAYVGEDRWILKAGTKFQAVLAGAAGISLDLDVEFARSQRRPHAVRVRLAAIWNPVKDEHVLLLTNLDRAGFPLALLGEVYRLRWQVELLFKEWKSYANLHAFTTRNEHIAEGLIWASLAAAFFKRFCAQATAQVFPAVVISTRRAAMALARHLGEVMFALVHQKATQKPLRQMLRYLKEHAQRANPRRDNKTGRGRTGLRPWGCCSQSIWDSSLQSEGRLRLLAA